MPGEVGPDNEEGKDWKPDAGDFLSSEHPEESPVAVAGLAAAGENEEAEKSEAAQKAAAARASISETPDPHAGWRGQVRDILPKAGYEPHFDPSLNYEGAPGGDRNTVKSGDDTHVSPDHIPDALALNHVLARAEENERAVASNDDPGHDPFAMPEPTGLDKPWPVADRLRRGMRRVVRDYQSGREQARKEHQEQADKQRQEQADKEREDKRRAEQWHDAFNSIDPPKASVERVYNRPNQPISSPEAQAFMARLKSGGSSFEGSWKSENILGLLEELKNAGMIDPEDSLTINTDFQVKNHHNPFKFVADSFMEEGFKTPGYFADLQVYKIKNPNNDKDYNNSALVLRWDENLVNKKYKTTLAGFGVVNLPKGKAAFKKSDDKAKQEKLERLERLKQREEADVDRKNEPPEVREEAKRKVEAKYLELRRTITKPEMSDELKDAIRNLHFEQALITKQVSARAPYYGILAESHVEPVTEESIRGTNLDARNSVLGMIDGAHAHHKEQQKKAKSRPVDGLKSPRVVAEKAPGNLEDLGELKNPSGRQFESEIVPDIALEKPHHDDLEDLGEIRPAGGTATEAEEGVPAEPTLEPTPESAGPAEAVPAPVDVSAEMPEREAAGDISRFEPAEPAASESKPAVPEPEPASVLAEKSPEEILKEDIHKLSEKIEKIKADRMAEAPTPESRAPAAVPEFKAPEEAPAAVKPEEPELTDENVPVVKKAKQRPESVMDRVVNRLRETDDEFRLPELERQMTESQLERLAAVCRNEAEINALQRELLDRDSKLQEKEQKFQIKTDKRGNPYPVGRKPSAGHMLDIIRSRRQEIKDEQRRLAEQKRARKYRDQMGMADEDDEYIDVARKVSDASGKIENTKFEAGTFESADADVREKALRKPMQKPKAQAKPVPDIDDILHRLDTAIADAQAPARRADRPAGAPGTGEVVTSRQAEVPAKTLRPIAAPVVEPYDNDRISEQAQLNAAHDEPRRTRRAEAAQQAVGVGNGIISSESESISLASDIDRVGAQKQVDAPEIDALYDRAIAEGYINPETRESTGSPEADTALAKIMELYNRHTEQIDRTYAILDEIKTAREMKNITEQRRGELLAESFRKAADEGLVRITGRGPFGVEAPEKESEASRILAQGLNELAGGKVI